MRCHSLVPARPPGRAAPKRPLVPAPRKISASNAAQVQVAQLPPVPPPHPPRFCSKDVLTNTFDQNTSRDPQSSGPQTMVVLTTKLKPANHFSHCRTLPDSRTCFPKGPRKPAPRAPLRSRASESVPDNRDIVNIKVQSPNRTSSDRQDQNTDGDRQAPLTRGGQENMLVGRAASPIRMPAPYMSCVVRNPRRHGRSVHYIPQRLVPREQEGWRDVASESNCSSNDNQLGQASPRANARNKHQRRLTLGPHATLMRNISEERLRLAEAHEDGENNSAAANRKLHFALQHKSEATSRVAAVCPPLVRQSNMACEGKIRNRTSKRSPKKSVKKSTRKRTPKKSPKKSMKKRIKKSIKKHLSKSRKHTERSGRSRNDETQSLHDRKSQKKQHSDKKHRKGRGQSQKRSPKKSRKGHRESITQRLAKSRKNGSRQDVGRSSISKSRKRGSLNWSGDVALEMKLPHQLQLHKAASLNDTALILRLLFSGRCSPNARDDEFDTPLHLAKSLGTACALVRYGARRDLKNFAKVRADNNFRRKEEIAALKDAEAKQRAADQGLLEAHQKIDDVEWKHIRKRKECVRCSACSLLFGVTRQRRHCRLCGKEVCSSCSGLRFWVRDDKDKSPDGEEEGDDAVKPVVHDPVCNEFVVTEVTPARTVPHRACDSCYCKLTADKLDRESKQDGDGPIRDGTQGVIHFYSKTDFGWLFETHDKKLEGSAKLVQEFRRNAALVVANSARANINVNSNTDVSLSTNTTNVLSNANAHTNVSSNSHTDSRTNTHLTTSTNPKPSTSSVTGTTTAKRSSLHSISTGKDETNNVNSDRASDGIRKPACPSTPTLASEQAASIVRTDNSGRGGVEGADGYIPKARMPIVDEWADFPKFRTSALRLPFQSLHSKCNPFLNPAVQACLLSHPQTQALLQKEIDPRRPSTPDTINLGGAEGTMRRVGSRTVLRQTLYGQGTDNTHNNKNHNRSENNDNGNNHDSLQMDADVTDITDILNLTEMTVYSSDDDLDDTVASMSNRPVAGGARDTTNLFGGLVLRYDQQVTEHASAKPQVEAVELQIKHVEIVDSGNSLVDVCGDLSDVKPATPRLGRQPSQIISGGDPHKVQVESLELQIKHVQVVDIMEASGGEKPATAPGSLYRRDVRKLTDERTDLRTGASSDSLQFPEFPAARADEPRLFLPLSSLDHRTHPRQHSIGLFRPQQPPPSAHSLHPPALPIPPLHPPTFPRCSVLPRTTRERTPPND